MINAIDQDPSRFIITWMIKQCRRGITCCAPTRQISDFLSNIGKIYIKSIKIKEMGAREELLRLRR